jgi:hypothetical protein
MIEKHGDYEIKVKRNGEGMLVMQLPGHSDWTTYDGRCGECSQFPSNMEDQMIFPVKDD